MRNNTTKKISKTVGFVLGASAALTIALGGGNASGLTIGGNNGTVLDTGAPGVELCEQIPGYYPWARDPATGVCSYAPTEETRESNYKVKHREAMQSDVVNSGSNTRPVPAN